MHPGVAVFVNTNVLLKSQRGQEKHAQPHQQPALYAELVSGFPQSIVQQRYIAPLERCATLGEVLLRPDVPWQKDAIEHFRAAFAAFVGDTIRLEILVPGRADANAAFCCLEKYAGPVSAKPTSCKNKDSVRIKQMLGLHPRAICRTADGGARSAAASSISESECYRMLPKSAGRFSDRLPVAVPHTARRRAALPAST
jgi:hypothetical protein